MGKIIKPYRFDKMESFTNFIQTLRTSGLHLPVSEDFSVLGREVSIGRRTIPNSIAIHPLEGCDCTINGVPSELTNVRYRNFARGGAGLIWIEACAVSRDGRDCPTQMWLHEGSVKELANLVNSIDREAEKKWGHKPYKVLQLTHSGRESSDDGGKPAPLAAFENPYLDKYYPNVRVADDDRLQQLEDEMAEAAVLSAEAGIDSIDIKLCHNYIIRELLAAFTRPGKYGGSFENRTRFVFNVIDKIQKKLGDSVEISVRINAYDCIPYPYGWGMIPQEGVMEADLTEPARLMRMLYARGVRLFNISCMMPRCLPSGMGFRAVFEEDAEIMPYAGVEKLLDATRILKQSTPGSIIVASGLSWFCQFAANIGAGGIEEQWFDIAGFGRQALVDPYFASEILSGKGLDAEKSCIACDWCYKCLAKDLPAGCVAKNHAYNRILSRYLIA
jgi:2,4-dienoyl-CoA reductase-like NADH-dependent reductase (Old Yellow Enzyme family)